MKFSLFLLFMTALFSAGCSCTEQSPSVSAAEKGSAHTDIFKDCRVLLAAAAENYSKGRFGSSAAACTEAINIQPALTEALVLRALCLMEFGDFRGAERDLAKALACDPGRSRTLSAKGRLEHISGNLRQAAEDYTKALTLDSSSFRDRYGRGLVYASLGRFREAKADMDVFLRAEPDSGKGWAARAENLFALGKLNQALADCGLALEKDPASAAAWACRSRICLKKGFIKKAGFCCRRAAEQFRTGQVPSAIAGLAAEIKILSGKKFKGIRMSDVSGGSR